MRYPDGGGLSAEQRKRREEVRLRAADLFEGDAKVPCIARELRVSEKSVYQWRRAWEFGGREALCSKGPPGYDCRLRLDLQAKPSKYYEYLRATSEDVIHFAMAMLLLCCLARTAR